MYKKININDIMNIVPCDNGDEFSIIDFNFDTNDSIVMPTVIVKEVQFDKTYDERSAYKSFLKLVDDNETNELSRDFKDYDYEGHARKLTVLIQSAMTLIAVDGRVGPGQFAIMGSNFYNIYRLNPIPTLNVIIDDNLDYILVGRKNKIDEPSINCYTDNDKMQIINTTDGTFKQYTKLRIENIVNLRLEKLKKLMSGK